MADDVPLSDETRSALLRTSVATLTTCLLKRGFRTRLITGAFPVNSSAARMAGPAYTLRFIPSREDIDSMAAYQSAENKHRRAIEECPSGHVLVIDARGEPGAASAGDIMIGRLKARGVAGIVTDGGFRDTPDIEALGFPAFHRAPAPPSSPICHHPLDLDVPIGCGGVAVYPRDILVGDREGVVVIPRHLADEIASEARDMTLYEEFAAAEVARGRSIFGLYPPSDESRQAFEKAGKRRRR
jgi:regulator of RNase E activity RraA